MLYSNNPIHGKVSSVDVAQAKTALWMQRGLEPQFQKKASEGLRMELKRIAGEKACEAIESGMIVGLGTGSTVYYTIKKLGEMVSGGLDIKGIPTSIQSETLAKEVGIPLTTLDENPVVDVTIDGADEVDGNLNLVKGMGCALLREKIVAAASKKEIIVVDDSKIVEKLGTKSPLPVEVLTFGSERTKNVIEKAYGCTGIFREKDGSRVLTDNNNYLLELKFAGIDDAPTVDVELNSIPGVMENGLFIGLTNTVIVASGEGIKLLGEPL